MQILTKHLNQRASGPRNPPAPPFEPIMAWRKEPGDAPPGDATVSGLVHFYYNYRSIQSEARTNPQFAG